MDVPLAGDVVTDVVHTDTQVELAADAAGVVEHCASIEQAKGMLTRMLALGLNPDDAFDVLRAHTQNSKHINVHDHAERPTAIVIEDRAPKLTRGWCSRSCAT